MTRFRYFPTFPEGACFDARPCAFCGATPALDGAWLDVDEDYDDPPPVCIEDLLRDRARVAIPAWMQQDLADHVATAHPAWAEQRKAAYVAARTAALAHTPPVPWLQENEWPVCADDYACFDGELTRERLEQRYGGPMQAQAAFQRILTTYDRHGSSTPSRSLYGGSVWGDSCASTHFAVPPARRRMFCRRCRPSSPRRGERHEPFPSKGLPPGRHAISVPRRSAYAAAGVARAPAAVPGRGARSGGLAAWRDNTRHQYGAKPYNQ